MADLPAPFQRPAFPRLRLPRIDWAFLAVLTTSVGFCALFWAWIAHAILSL